MLTDKGVPYLYATDVLVSHCPDGQQLLLLSAFCTEVALCFQAGREAARCAGAVVSLTVELQRASPASCR
jgi:hypothetical protein